MQIYDALKADHNAIKELLSELVNLEEDADFRSDLVNQIRDELIPHVRAEEAVFYNALRTLDSAKNIIKHSYREHLEAEALLRALQLKTKMDMETRTLAKKLRAALNNHIEEEENRIFAVAHRHLTDQESEMICQAFEALKPKIRDEGIVKTTFDFVANLMPPRFASALGLENEAAVEAQKRRTSA